MSAAPPAREVAASAAIATTAPAVAAPATVPVPQWQESALLPGELGVERWVYPPIPGATPAIDAGQLKALATRALAAGDGRLTAVGVASLQHGAGTTTVARHLAVTLAGAFGKRVVLLEANQRSPSLRRIYALPDGPGLCDVLARRITLGGALQIAGEQTRILMLPAAVKQDAILDADGLRGLLASLFVHADAVVVDLAPVLPYRDTAAICAALDGVALVMEGGANTVAEGQAAVERIRAGGTDVLGAVLNREKAAVPRLLRKLTA